MILEAAFLEVIPGKEEVFEKDFQEAEQYIRVIDGYIEHTLQKCIEVENKYLLLVKWKTIEDHTIGFRQSEGYLKWKQLLHHYYNPFPTVEHFKKVR